MRTRGDQAWVRKTATGLPDCTRRVSSSSRLHRGHYQKLSQSRAAFPRAAVDDEVLRALRDLGIEVVHEHA